MGCKLAAMHWKEANGFFGGICRIALGSDKGYGRNRAEGGDSFDREGNRTILEDKVVQVSEFACQTLDGNPEPAGAFGFQSCSPYFVKNKVKRRAVSLQTVESGDTVETGA